MRWPLGLGAPLLAAAVCAGFVTPNGSLAVKAPSAWCSNSPSSAGIAALAGIGRSGVAASLGIVVVIHLGLTFPLDQR